MGLQTSAQSRLKAAVLLMLYALVCAAAARFPGHDHGHDHAGGHGWGHEEGQFNGASGNQASLRSLPKHIQAAEKLVQQLKLPDRLPLQPSGIVGTDPAKLATGLVTQAAAEAQCDGMVGQQFLEQWHATEHIFCSSDSDVDSDVDSDSSSSSSSSQGGVSSEVKCYVAPEHKQNKPLTACVATNVVVSSTKAFMGKSTPNPVEASFPKTDILMSGFVYRLPRPEAGSVKVACKAAAVNKTARIVPNITANGPAGYVMVDHVAQWLVTGLHDRQYEAVQQACGSTGGSVVEHPVLFVTRIGTTNIFHAMEDLVVAIATLAAHHSEIADGRLQVVFDDQDDPYPFALEDLWRQLSTAAPVRYLRSQPFPANTCFRKAIIVPIGFTSSLLSIATEKQMLCRSVLAIGVSSWLREVSGHVSPARHPPTTFASKLTATRPKCTQPYNGTVERLQILFLARHKWGFHHSGDPTQNISSYEYWRLVRDLHNEEEIIDMVRETAHTWNKGVCAYQEASAGQKQPNCRHARATFDVAVHEHHHHHNMPRQLEDSTSASILVGVHGAGLTHAMFMSPGGAVLEIMPRPGNTHFLSISNMMGHGYVRSDYDMHERRGNVADVQKKLLQVMLQLGGCQ